MPRSQPEYEPTPEEIAEACREIQSEWTAWEEARRRGRRLEDDAVQLHVCTVRVDRPRTVFTGR